MKGRSVCVVNDLSIAEQRELYKIAAQVKSRISAGQFPSDTSKSCSYLMFFEDSTRTKESFRNAAATLNHRVNIFDASSSSVNKFETLNDTVRMLCGYTPSMQSVFVIRSKIEGLCRALSDSITEYTTRVGIETPSFVNAGDGRHEHPTQEFLDEFSFLEQLGNDTRSIHIALIGDLLLGRTIHSKADGLCLFDNVTVDLVAPPELHLPADYIAKMKKNGFKLNFFNSLDEYLSSHSVKAPIMYFTRLQLERMDKSMLEKETELRAATTLRMEMLHRLPVGCKIYHPLPRHGQLPEIPFEVDTTSFNGYDEQSRNGYFVRTALLGLLTCVYGHSLADPPISPPRHPRAVMPSISDAVGPVDHTSLNEFFLRIAAANPRHDEAWIDVVFPPKTTPAEVRKNISRMRVLSDTDKLDGYCQVTGNWGIHSIPKSLVDDPNWLLFFNSFFSYCESAEIIFQKSELEFYKLSCKMPHVVTDLPGLGCPNTACVCHPDMKQRDVKPVFEQVSGNKNFSCRFCEKQVNGRDIFQIQL